MPELETEALENHVMLTLDEMASLLRTTPEAVRARVRRGSIPAHCVCDVVRPVLFRRDAVTAWLAGGAE